MPAAPLLALAAALTLAAAPAPQPPGEPAGPPPAPLLAEDAPLPTAVPEPRIVAIEIRSDAPLPAAEELRKLLTIAVGQPLTEEAMRRTLFDLHAAGIASDIEIRSRLEGEEAAVVTVVIRADAQVEEVRLEGELGLAREVLERAVEQGEGQPLAEGKVLQGLYQLQELYRERGFLSADVDLAVEFLDEAEKRARVLYRVASGPRATIASVDFTGELAPFSEEELREQLGIQVGDRYRRRAAREAAERLTRWLISKDYRLAEVESAETPGTDRMHLSYQVNVGPRLLTRIEGVSLSQRQRRELLPFLGPEGYDEALLYQAEERLVRHFQERGHYQVEVQSQERRQEGVLEVDLDVAPGPVFDLAAVRFEGNRRVSSEILSSLMATSAKRFLGLGSARLVSAALEEDVENIRSYYALEGFDQATVEDPRVEIEGDQLTVVIAVDEGRRRRVADVRFEGVQAFDPAQLQGELGTAGLLTPGGAYHRILLDDSLTLLRSRYEALGYDQVRVSAETDWSEDGTRAAVTIRVLEGPQTVIDRVLVRGFQKTRPEVIRRAVGLSPGEPVSRAVALEAQHRLYGLGIFSEVDVRLAPADPGSRRRNVVVEVAEGKNQRLRYGLGYDTEDGPRGLLGYSYSNLLGRAYSFRSDLRLSERDQHFRLSLEQPYSFRGRVPLTYTLFYIDEEQKSFDVARWGGRVEAVRRFSRGRRLSLIYDYRIVDPRLRIEGDGGDGLDRQDREVRISSLIPNFLFDRRNDLVNPSAGWSSYIQLQYAFPFLQTDEEFLKLFLQHTQYVPVGGFGVVALSLRGGGIEPFRTAVPDPDLPPGLPSSEVSIAERFFAGGTYSHRAYRLDELGIPGETLLGEDPVGGNGLLLANLDLRFPISGAFGGVVFADAGNVWADWRDIDPSQAKVGAGLGVRYISPIGPVRLEIGWKLDREEFESPYAVFLSVGNPF